MYLPTHEEAEKAAQAETQRRAEQYPKLVAALKRLMASDETINNATEDLLVDASNEKTDPELAEQAASVLQARATLKQAGEME